MAATETRREMSPVCDWCGKHIAAGAAMWGYGIGRRVGDPPTPSWIACSEEHLDLLLARYRAAR